MMSIPRGAGRWRTAFLVASGASVLFATPILVHYSLEKPMISADKPLKQEAIRRGAFNNSGSRDCGPDPNWVDGRYQRRKRSETI